MTDYKIICKKCKEEYYFYDEDGLKIKILGDSVAINGKKPNYVCSECGHKHFKISMGCF